jgi:hypothetical protein
MLLQQLINNNKIFGLIDWCLAPTLAVYQLYRGVKIFYILLFFKIFFMYTVIAQIRCSIQHRE